MCYLKYTDQSSELVATSHLDYIASMENGKKRKLIDISFVIRVIERFRLESHANRRKRKVGIVSLTEAGNSVKLGHSQIGVRRVVLHRIQSTETVDKRGLDYTLIPLWNGRTEC